MAQHLLRDLDELQRDVLAMGRLVEESVHKATRALREADERLAGEVIAGDDSVDAKENQVQEECLKIVAVHHPVAGDLRLVTSAMRIATDLERIGDLAKKIAQRALVLARPPRLAVPEGLQRMTDLAATMVRQSLDVFVDQDRDQAYTVLRLDDEVDRHQSEIIAEVVAVMKDSPGLVEPALSLFSAVRHVERVADHATNIAEDVIYLVEGEVVRHRPPPGALPG